MTDPDEEYETDDVDAPVPRSIQSGTTQAVADLQVVGKKTPDHDRREECCRDVEPARGIDERSQKRLFVGVHPSELLGHIATHSQCPRRR